MSFSFDRVTTGTYDFASVYSNAANAAETFTAGFAFETFAVFILVAAIASLLTLLNTTQFLDQVKISSISR